MSSDITQYCGSLESYNRHRCADILDCEQCPTGGIASRVANKKVKNPNAGVFAGSLDPVAMVRLDQAVTYPGSKIFPWKKPGIGHNCDRLLSLGSGYSEQAQWNQRFEKLTFRVEITAPWQLTMALAFH